MSAMAQALAKVGLADKEKAANIDKEREEFRDTYVQISRSIGELFRRKRALKDLADAVKGNTKRPAADLTLDVKRFFGMVISNFTSKTNQFLILDKIKEELDLVEKMVSPMLKASRKLEKEWGFERPGKR